MRGALIPQNEISNKPINQDEAKHDHIILPSAPFISIPFLPQHILPPHHTRIQHRLQTLPRPRKLIDQQPFERILKQRDVMHEHPKPRQLILRYEVAGEQEERPHHGRDHRVPNDEVRHQRAETHHHRIRGV